jgi:hypothetical protein
MVIACRAERLYLLREMDAIAGNSHGGDRPDQELARSHQLDPASVRTIKQRIPIDPTPSRHLSRRRR